MLYLLSLSLSIIRKPHNTCNQLWPFKKCINGKNKRCYVNTSLCIFALFTFVLLLFAVWNRLEGQSCRSCSKNHQLLSVTGGCLLQCSHQCYQLRGMRCPLSNRHQHEQWEHGGTYVNERKVKWKVYPYHINFMQYVCMCLLCVGVPYTQTN